MADRFVLVLAGGRGERFWPWSLPERPKQLLPLASGGRTLIRATIERALRVAPAERVVVLTARDLRDAVREACGTPGVRVLAEPVQRNTAPAIGAIAARFAAEADDPAFAVMPSDHAIEDDAAFQSDIEASFDFVAREAALVTFGVRPTHAETNFGYIQRGAAAGRGFHRVTRFTEKPDLARAEGWLAEGGYLWNSGIFVWRCSTFMDALEAGRPDLAGPLRSLDACDDAALERDMVRVFPELEGISVDYAVLERARNTFVREASFDWDDLGSWGAWARRQPRDERGNVLFGDAVAIDCDGCIVVGEHGPAAAVGLRDTIVVHARGGTLACPRDRGDRVRQVGEALRAREKR